MKSLCVSLGKDTKHASYSTPGAALLVSAPGGDKEYVTNNVVAKPGGGCHDIGWGTSYAAPAVTGVIALMLEANGDLGWRDVQGILVETSRQIDQTDDSWTKNGAGKHQSNFYGFGLVDAHAAVTAAESWKNVGPERQVLRHKEKINLAIPDDSSKTTNSALKISGHGGMVVKSVVVSLDLIHSSRGDLKIVLTSPQGTESILHPGKRKENTQLQGEARWKLTTVRNWGEKPDGLWTLSIVDERQSEAANTSILKSWAMIVYGHARNSGTAYKEHSTVLSSVVRCLFWRQPRANRMSEGRTYRAEIFFLQLCPPKSARDETLERT